MRPIFGAAGAAFACIMFAVAAFPSKTIAASSAASSLVVTVVQDDGQPAVGLKVLVQVTPPSAPGIGAGHGGGLPHMAVNGGQDGAIELAGAGQVVAQATTDDKGVAEFKTLKAGEYTLRCGNPTKGFGGGSATISDGQTATVTIKLSAPKKKA